MSDYDNGFNDGFHVGYAAGDNSGDGGGMGSSDWAIVGWIALVVGIAIIIASI